MNAIASGIHLLLCGAAGWLAARWYVSSRLPRPAAAVLAGIVVSSAVFFGAFLVLGWIGLAVGRPLLRTDLALLLSAPAACAAWLAVRRRVDAAVRLPGPDGGRRFVWTLDQPSLVVLIAVGVTFAALSLLLCLGFPRGFEPRSYHLPIAAHFFQTHSLTFWDTERMDTFPANASLYFGFLSSFLPERIVSASNIALLVVLLAGLYGLGRSVGADASAAVVAACGAATIPIVSFSALEAGADIGAAAFLAAALYFALAPDPRRVSDLFLSGLAAGLAFGFKSLHLVSAGFLTLWIFWRRGRSEESPSHASRWSFAAGGSLIFLAGFLAAAGVWLLRSWDELGNPLYPVHFGALSDALGWKRAPDINFLERGAMQREWVRSDGEWFGYPWIEWHAHGENFKHSSGLGAFFAALIVPALLVSLVAVLRGREARARIGALLAGAGVVFGVWWALVDRQPRYLMGLLVYAIPLVAWMISRSLGQSRRVLGTIACVTSVLMLLVVLSRFGVEASSWIVHRRWSRSAFYRYPALLDRCTSPCTVVNLIDRPENYGLFGAGLDNRVINSRRALRELGADPEAGPPASLALDAAALRRLGATHVFASSTTRLSASQGLNLIEVGHLAGASGAGRVLYQLRYPPP